jgi:D-alanyl-D-alanine carboxypeptidase
VVRNREEFQTLAPAYSFSVSSDGMPVDIRKRYDPGWVATGVVAATAADIVRFYGRLFAGDLLPGRLLKEMQTVVRASTAPTTQRHVAPSYGLGLTADPMSPYGVLYGHNGGGPGYTSAAFYICSPSRQPLTVAVLSNTENFFEVELMAFTIVDELMQAR